MQLAKRNYGWRPDSLDHRDYRFVPSRAALRRLPSSIDLAKFAPPVMDQGAVGSCTGCSSSAGYALTAKKQGNPFAGSALFAYWNARSYIGETSWDSGAEIRDAIKGLNEFGLAADKTWPYLPSKTTKKPTKKAFTEGLLHQAIRYERVDNSDVANIKAALAEQCPVVFGFTVYPSFERIGKSGVMPMPKKSERPLGGHAVCAVGYDDKTGRVKVLNSWGKSWGKSGYFFMPYAFIADTDYCDDFWKIQGVE